MNITCSAPVNIAIVKYWGKSNEELILPLNSSLSITLNQADLKTVTTVALSTSFEKDRIWLNGIEGDINNVRIQNCLSAIRQVAIQTWKGYSPSEISSYRVHICSKNNFPTGAGLASSASGFACLVFALARSFGIDAEVDLSEIARQGSGSACRSMYGGFVEWQKGNSDGTESKAVQVAPADYWPELKVLILVVSDKKKTVSSSVGMQSTVKTSDLLKFRAEVIVPQRIQELKEAIRNRDFQAFGTLTMKESNQFHSMCMDTYPPLFYLNDTSRDVIRLITEYNEVKDCVSAAYTFDAGPNAVLIAPSSNIQELLSLVLHYFPSSKPFNEFVRTQYAPTTFSPNKKLTDRISLSPQLDCLQYIIHTEIGDGPIVLPETDREGKSNHLLDRNGVPL